jgi:hypothetical protein
MALDVQVVEFARLQVIYIQRTLALLYPTTHSRGEKKHLVIRNMDYPKDPSYTQL